MGLTEFFAMEAGEYLERLDALVSPAAPPDSEEFLRLARALRGSALMANQHSIANTAAAFEGLARAVREQRRSWDEATKQLAIRAVDDLKVLVRSVAEWSESAESRATGLTAELEHAIGKAPSSPAPRTVQGLDPGTRAFLAREGAAVASTLHEAARGLQQNPMAHEPLERVLKVMQPLRGLAILSEIPPMGELLQGIEQAIGEVSRRSGRTVGADLLFEAAAKALARAAREIAAEGRAEAESQETQDFAHRLAAILDEEAEAVSIDSLYYDDEGPHVVKEGTATARPAQLGRLELVSHGEHLRLAADELERARTTTQRELRAQALAGTFRALAAAVGGPLEEAVSRFGHAAREALGHGTPVSRTRAFATQLREAGTTLSLAAQGDDQVLAQRLNRLVGAVRDLVTAAPEPWETAHEAAPAAPAIATPSDRAPHRPAATSAAVRAEEVATPPTRPQAPEPPAAPAARPEPAVSEAAAARPAPGPPLAEPPNLAGSWIRYERFTGTLGFAEASLEELVSGPPPETLAPALVTGDGAEVGEAVPITSLCYGGTAALKRALTLQKQLQVELGRGADDARVGELIQEVFDLVRLGLERGE
jgi:chemotaxis protein histidine kinase CheA